MERFDGWDTELYHHGIKGQKWGIRRFQNPDGTLTEEGKARYSDDVKAIAKNLNTLDRQRARLSVKQRQTKNPGKAIAYDTQRKQIEKAIGNALSEAQKKGYTVQSKETRRLVITGKDAVKGLVGIAAGVAMVNVVTNIGAFNALSRGAYGSVNWYALGQHLGRAGVTAAAIAHRVRGEKGTKYKVGK